MHQHTYWVAGRLMGGGDSIARKPLGQQAWRTAAEGTRKTGWKTKTDLGKLSSDLHPQAAVHTLNKYINSSQVQMT